MLPARCCRRRQVVLYEDLVLNHDVVGGQLRAAGLGDVDPRRLFRFDRTPKQVRH